MEKKIIFFSIDRLGDYLIRSNTMYQISKKFDYSEIVCSDKNYNLVKTQSFFNKKISFNTKKKFINKLKLIVNFLLSEYDTVIAFDGKNISSILLFIIRSKYKYIFFIKKSK